MSLKEIFLTIREVRVDGLENLPSPEKRKAVEVVGPQMPVVTSQMQAETVGRLVDQFKNSHSPIDLARRTK